VSTGGGVWPSWSNDGGQVFFNAGTATMALGDQREPVLAAADPVIVRDGARRDRARRAAHRSRLVLGARQISKDSGPQS
jgi:hypothetical protein